jgi:hypothetical protein
MPVRCVSAARGRMCTHRTVEASVSTRQCGRRSGGPAAVLARGSAPGLHAGAGSAVRHAMPEKLVPQARSHLTSPEEGRRAGAVFGGGNLRLRPRHQPFAGGCSPRSAARGVTPLRLRAGFDRRGVKGQGGLAAGSVRRRHPQKMPVGLRSTSPSSSSMGRWVGRSRYSCQRPFWSRQYNVHPRLAAVYRSWATGDRVQSGPRSGCQGGRASKIVTALVSRSHSTRSSSRKRSGTRRRHHARTRATSSSGGAVDGIGSVCQRT